MPRVAVDDVDHRVVGVDLEQPVLGGLDDLEPLARQRLGGPGGVLVGHHEVHVVVGLGSTARPHGVAADQRERDPALLERHCDALECFAQVRLLLEDHG
ncbi:hypothetical protein [Nocardioides pakistanensis]